MIVLFVIFAIAAQNVQTTTVQSTQETTLPADTHTTLTELPINLDSKTQEELVIHETNFTTTRNEEYFNHSINDTTETIEVQSTTPLVETTINQSSVEITSGKSNLEQFTPVTISTTLEHKDVAVDVSAINNETTEDDKTADEIFNSVTNYTTSKSTDTSLTDIVQKLFEPQYNIDDSEGISAIHHESTDFSEIETKSNVHYGTTESQEENVDGGFEVDSAKSQEYEPQTDNENMYITEQTIPTVFTADVMENATDPFENESYFSGSILSKEGKVCAAINISLQLFVAGIPLHLPLYYGDECTYSDNNGSITFYSGDTQENYNVTSQFFVQCEEMTCFIDKIKIDLYDIFLYKQETGVLCDLQLYTTKLGDTSIYHSKRILGFDNGMTLEINSVKFFVAKNGFGSYFLADVNPIIKYYKEILGGIGAFIVVAVSLGLVFKKVHTTRKNSFNTMKS